MNRKTLAAVLLCAGAWIAFSSHAGRAEEESPDAPVDHSAKAIARWDKTCQRCHAVPDLRFETDRAFLGQIMETT